MQGGNNRYLNIMETELERINSIVQEMLYLGKSENEASWLSAVFSNKS